jgi:starch phosphorylase
LPAALCGSGQPAAATVDQESEQYFFQVQVFLDDLDPDAIKVELYAEAQNGGEPVRQPIGSANSFIYSSPSS